MTLARKKPEGTAVSTVVRFPRRDNEFLPAALEIIETPISPIRYAIILTICAFFAAALVWCYVGRIDIIAVAQGKIQPIGRTKVIEPLETGKVQSLPVVNGQHVKAGDLLFQLDESDAKSDIASQVDALDASQAEALRRSAAVEAATSRNLATVPQVSWPDDIPEAIRNREQHILASDLGQLNATVASLEAQRLEKIAQRDRLNSTIAAQKELVATLKERVDMRTSLLASSSGSKATVIDAKETYQYHAANLAMYEGQLGETEAATRSSQADVEKAIAAFVAENAQKLGAAERDARTARDKLVKARIALANMRLVSPIDGVAQGLSVTTLGQVVRTGEQLMEIVPEDSKLEIEAYVPNQDVGFLGVGQTAAVKVEAFPFTTYGTLDATVETVGLDALPLNQAEKQEGNPTAPDRDLPFGGVQHVQNLVYPVTLALKSSQIRVGNIDTPLVPGMAVTVEIKTGTRRIIEFIFSPILKIASTAMRER